MSQQILCKFNCGHIGTAPGSDHKQITFRAVTSGSEENKSFSKYTPAGQLTLTVSPETPAYDAFKEGKDYFLTITEAPEPTIIPDDGI